MPCFHVTSGVQWTCTCKCVTLRILLFSQLPVAFKSLQLWVYSTIWRIQELYLHGIHKRAKVHSLIFNWTVTFTDIQDSHHLSDTLQALSHNLHPPGTHHPCVGEGSMEWEVYVTLPHMTSTGNSTPNLLILSPCNSQRTIFLSSVYCTHSYIPPRSGLGSRSILLNITYARKQNSL